MNLKKKFQQIDWISTNQIFLIFSYITRIHPPIFGHLCINGGVDDVFRRNFHRKNQNCMVSSLFLLHLIVYMCVLGVVLAIGCCLGGCWVLFWLLGAVLSGCWVLSWWENGGVKVSFNAGKRENTKKEEGKKMKFFFFLDDV